MIPGVVSPGSYDRKSGGNRTNAAVGKNVDPAQKRRQRGSKPGKLPFTLVGAARDIYVGRKIDFARRRRVHVVGAGLRATIKRRDNLDRLRARFRFCIFYLRGIRRSNYLPAILPSDRSCSEWRVFKSGRVQRLRRRR